eukprot:10963726-Lingulodinium_polyedra.AAC.1
MELPRWQWWGVVSQEEFVRVSVATASMMPANTNSTVAQLKIRIGSGVQDSAEMGYQLCARAWE